MELSAICVAVETSTEIVIPEDETKLGGWTALSPVFPCSPTTKQLEEKVLLLTEHALYVCTYHFELEKISQYRRIGLTEVIKIQKGEVTVPLW